MRRIISCLMASPVVVAVVRFFRWFKSFGYHGYDDPEVKSWRELGSPISTSRVNSFIKVVTFLLLCGQKGGRGFPGSVCKRFMQTVQLRLNCGDARPVYKSGTKRIRTKFLRGIDYCSNIHARFTKILPENVLCITTKVDHNEPLIGYVPYSYTEDHLCRI